MYKKLILILTITVLSMVEGIAQKYAIVDINFVLKSLPEYAEAQKKLDDLSEKWQKDVERMFADADAKQQSLQQEMILLPPDVVEQKKVEIGKLREKARSLQQDRFGINGDLFKKRAELIDPIQEKVAKAIKQMAKDKGYDFIMDKGKANILYVNPKYDKTESLIRKLN